MRPVLAAAAAVALGIALAMGANPPAALQHSPTDIQLPTLTTED